MTIEELTIIEDRVTKASPGPWKVEPDIRPDIKNHKICQAVNDLEKQINVFRYLQKKDSEKDNAGVWSDSANTGYCGEGQIVKDMSKGIGHVCELAKYWEENHSNIDDAEFIANARSDVSLLIEEVRRCWKLLGIS